VSDLRKDLVYPTVVGIVVGLILLFGGILVEQWRKPVPIPPAEIIYGYSSTTINSADLSERFPTKFSREDEENSIYTSTLFILNASGRSLRNLNFVATNRFYRPSKWIKLDVDISGAIFGFGNRKELHRYQWHFKIYDFKI